MKNVTKLIFAVLAFTIAATLLTLSVSACFEKNSFRASSEGELAVREAAELSAKEDVLTGVLEDSVSEDSSSASANVTSGIRFNALEKTVYDELKAHLHSVAIGSIASTEFTIEIDDPYLSWTKADLGCSIYSSTGSVTSVAKTALKEKMNNDTLLVKYMHLSLLSDCPYDLFWYDKTVGVKFNYNYKATSEQMYITSLTYSFTVSKDYRYSTYSTYKVSSAKIAAANSVLPAIEAIVEKYADKSDLEKLQAYKNEICALVSYNTDAAEGNYDYGNPWQLIHVFDGDPDTNVVCEGYSKAFKFLCDLTDFDKSIHCYLASGYIGGSHMWNVVSINGSNYLVDVTNCDTNPNQFDTALFLAGGTTADSGMTHVTATLTYTYKDSQYNLHTEGYLVLSETSYCEHTYSVEWFGDGTYHWHECSSCGDKIGVATHTVLSSATCTQRAVCAVCGEYGVLAHAFEQQVTTEAYLKSAATCLSSAVYYYSCTCGAKGETTFAFGAPGAHQFTSLNISEKYLAAPATCSNSPTYYYNCIYCRVAGTDTFECGSRLPHEFVQQNTDAAYLQSKATCTASAVYYYSCACGKQGTETFSYGDFTQHNYTSSWKSNGQQHWRECSCGNKIDISEHFSGTPATCTQKAICAVCRASYGDFFAHVFDKQVITDKYLYSSATCADVATYYYSCSCGAKGEETFAYGNLGDHSCDASGACTVCGFVLEQETPTVDENPTGGDSSDTSNIPNYQGTPDKSDSSLNKDDDNEKTEPYGNTPDNKTESGKSANPFLQFFIKLFVAFFKFIFAINTEY